MCLVNSGMAEEILLQKTNQYLKCHRVFPHHNGLLLVSGQDHLLKQLTIQIPSL